MMKSCPVVIVVLALLASAHGGPSMAGPVHRPWLDPATGKPFFPLGWYEWEDGCLGLPRGRPALAGARRLLDGLSEQGANALVFVNTWGTSASDDQLKQHVEFTRAFLDHAGTRGIKVIMGIGGHDAFLADDRAGIERQRRWVQAIADHPSLLGFEGYDEPEFRLVLEGPDARQKNQRFVDALVSQYDALRTWDANPNRLLHLTFNLVPPIDARDWRRFLPACDALHIDRYPINRQFDHFPRGDWGAVRCAWQISHGVAAIASTAHRNPVIVLQGMGKSVQRVIALRERRHGDLDVKQVRAGQDGEAT